MREIFIGDFKYLWHFYPAERRLLLRFWPVALAGFLMLRIREMTPWGKPQV